MRAAVNMARACLADAVSRSTCSVVVMGAMSGAGQRAERRVRARVITAVRCSSACPPPRSPAAGGPGGPASAGSGSTARALPSRCWTQWQWPLRASASHPALSILADCSSAPASSPASPGSQPCPHEHFSGRPHPYRQPTASLITPLAFLGPGTPTSRHASQTGRTGKTNSAPSGRLVMINMIAGTVPPAGPLNDPAIILPGGGFLVAVMHWLNRATEQPVPRSASGTSRCSIPRTNGGSVRALARE